MQSLCCSLCQGRVQVRGEANIQPLSILAVDNWFHLDPCLRAVRTRKGRCTEMHSLWKIGTAGTCSPSRRSWRVSGPQTFVATI
jgi:hypothetical protein